MKEINLTFFLVDHCQSFVVLTIFVDIRAHMDKPIARVSFPTNIIAHFAIFFLKSWKAQLPQNLATLTTYLPLFGQQHRLIQSDKTISSSTTSVPFSPLSGTLPRTI